LQTVKSFFDYLFAKAPPVPRSSHPPSILFFFFFLFTLTGSLFPPCSVFRAVGALEWSAAGFFPFGILVSAFFSAYADFFRPLDRNCVPFTLCLSFSKTVVLCRAFLPQLVPPTSPLLVQALPPKFNLRHRPPSPPLHYFSKTPVGPSTLPLTLYTRENQILFAFSFFHPPFCVY